MRRPSPSNRQASIVARCSEEATADSSDAFLLLSSTPSPPSHVMNPAKPTHVCRMQDLRSSKSRCAGSTSNSSATRRGPGAWSCGFANLSGLRHVFMEWKILIESLTVASEGWAMLVKTFGGGTSLSGLLGTRRVSTYCELAVQTCLCFRG